MRELIDWLNARTKEYNEGKPSISDFEWDKKYFELVKMEEESGIIYPDSPTQSICYDVIDSFEKINHNPSMLSLAKTKDPNEVKDFVKNKDYIVSLKLDGLSCRLVYDNGELILASTRGTGEVGDVVTSNVKTCRNVPKYIPYPNRLVIDGEIVITTKDFKLFSQDYKNPRNLAAGSLKLLDSGECAKRNLSFVAWDVINQGPNMLSGRLDVLSGWGFTTVPYIVNDFDKAYIELPETAEKLGYPIDGLVIKYDDVKYYRSLGTTSHHPSGALAIKFYDELYGTVLRNIEWQIGRSGILSPVAIFDPVEIDGSTVTRASLFNLDVLKTTLGFPYKGQALRVYKANMITPQVYDAIKLSIEPTKNIALYPPEICPICGGRTIEKPDGTSSFLYCDNSDCEGKFINRAEYFCGKKGLDIRGLSKATLEKLVSWGWVSNFIDIFNLKDHREEWIRKPGFGIKSVDKILSAIEESKINCQLNSFIAALGIPLIGATVTKDLTKYFTSWDEFIEAAEGDYKFQKLPNFGPEMNAAIHNYNYSEAKELATNYIVIRSVEQNSALSFPLDGMTFVVTGKLKAFKNRDELKKVIEDAGGKVVGSISSKTNYLVNNAVESTSSKNLAAKKLNVPIISEEELLEILTK